MALRDIINEVCEKCGYDATDDRELLLQVINRACQEVYEITDLPGSLREITVLAQADSLIALPYYVGPLRNIRSHYSLVRLTIQDLTSKYSFYPWQGLWDKWRLVNNSPIQRCIENSALPIVATIDDVDTVAINITITGKTATANRTSEVFTIGVGETEVQISTQFLAIDSITKDAFCNRDVTFTGADADGNEIELAVLPNDRLKCEYTIVDVSALPWGGDNGTNYRYVDVLYKSYLPRLNADGDEFICGSQFDKAIVCKVCEEFFGNKADGSDKALDYGVKCQMLIQKTISHQQGETEKRMTFEPNGLLNLYPPYYAPLGGGVFRGGMIP